MKIYTRQGDQGKTRLYDGTRVDKCHIRIVCVGCIDELNASLGIVRSDNDLQNLEKQIENIQQDLFCLGSEIAVEEIPANKTIPLLTDRAVSRLEDEIDVFDENLKPLENFILPGGHRTAAYLHVARTICRRAEQQIAALHQKTLLRPVLIQYVNRLSDWLFMAARFANRQKDIPDVPWNTSRDGLSDP